MGDASKQERLIFVLDDEAEVGSLVCKLAIMNGFVARQFTEPLEFFTQIKLHSPDTIVLDLALGQTDAVEVIRKLDALKFTGQVLLMSGRDQQTLNDFERIGSAHGLCMLPPLRKPFRGVELRNRLLAEGKVAPAAPIAPPKAPDRRIDLEEALRENWLELWYQPKVALPSLSLCGAEALVRARLPGGGIVQPVDLLPPAGDPLYQPLSVFVIQRAMTDWKRFADQGLLLKLAINIPVSVVNAPGFVDHVRERLPRDRKFPGLMIEVTEDEVVREPELISEVAAQLRLYRVWTSLDDFGTAYASLSRLKDVPFSELKLDKAFVTNCASDPLKRGLCQTVVELARRVNATVCAEGVEATDDLHCLIDLGFDCAQGYLFAKPMPAPQFLESARTGHAADRQAKFSSAPKAQERA
jgi:EAL domain-containing protein (putative c-di-GMP-specific phosphodiesterase class I)